MHTYHAHFQVSTAHAYICTCMRMIMMMHERADPSMPWHGLAWWQPHLHSMWSILCIDHIRHLVCIECVIFWYPIHTCYVWDQAVQQEKKFRWDWCFLYWNIFFKFQLWYWIQIYTTKYSNLLLIILILVWIVCSTYRKGEILMQKWHVTSQFVYCYIIHAILSGVGVMAAISRGLKFLDTNLNMWD